MADLRVLFSPNPPEIFSDCKKFPTLEPSIGMLVDLLVVFLSVGGHKLRLPLPRLRGGNTVAMCSLCQNAHRAHPITIHHGEIGGDIETGTLVRVFLYF